MNQMPDFLIEGPGDAAVTLLLAHGAGAGMDSPFMAGVSTRLAERSVRVARFEFAYMAARRTSGKRIPPPRADKLDAEFEAAVRDLASSHGIRRIAIGGKSMGGRVASHVADALFASGQAVGLVCLGYPFHPPKMPEKLRIEHLQAVRCPTLIVQGERDPFGSRAEVEGMPLAAQINVTWTVDGDHDFGPRGASGATRKGNLDAAADVVATFLKKLV